MRSWLRNERFSPEEATRLAPAFQNAQPFPHLVLDDVLDVEHHALSTFPGPEWPHWQGLGDTYQRDKLSCSDLALIPEPWRDLIIEMSAPPFLEYLTRLTGIAKLVPDPYLEGGGLHLSGPGGILAPHTDFHVYGRLDLYRRLNVIVYLNPEWSERDGGCLELRGSNGSAAVTVVPTFGRCVIFRTDDRSVHGFPVPIAADRYRRSVALYYYTAAEASTFSGDATTHWREHGDMTGARRRVRFATYRALMQTSRAFSVAAHVVNPNQGVGWLRTRMGNLRARRGPVEVRDP
jgi:hypothetical protein